MTMISRMGAVSRFCFLPIVLLLAVEGSPADRLPLQRTSKKKIRTGPLPYELKPWETRVDPKPRVVDLGKGKYGFRWIGSRGQELQVVFERPDMIDVVVEASVFSATGGQLSYRYRVHNLKSSLQRPAAPGTQGPTWRPAMQSISASSGSPQPPPDGARPAWAAREAGSGDDPVRVCGYPRLQDHGLLKTNPV